MLIFFQRALLKYLQKEYFYQILYFHYPWRSYKSFFSIIHHQILHYVWNQKPNYVQYTRGRGIVISVSAWRILTTLNGKLNIYMTADSKEYTSAHHGELPTSLKGLSPLFCGNIPSYSISSVSGKSIYIYICVLYWLHV